VTLLLLLQVCTQQLDWPFVGGTMRDGSVSPDRFTAQQVPTEARCVQYFILSVVSHSI
jgi:hypothetical protein